MTRHEFYQAMIRAVDDGLIVAKVPRLNVTLTPEEHRCAIRDRLADVSSAEVTYSLPS